MKHTKWSPDGSRLMFVFTNEIHFDRKYGELPRVKVWLSAAVSILQVVSLPPKVLGQATDSLPDAALEFVESVTA